MLNSTGRFVEASSHLDIASTSLFKGKRENQTFRMESYLSALLARGRPHHLRSSTKTMEMDRRLRDAETLSALHEADNTFSFASMARIKFKMMTGASPREHADAARNLSDIVAATGGGGGARGGGRGRRRRGRLVCERHGARHQRPQECASRLLAPALHTARPRHAA